MALTIESNVVLAPYTTMKVGGPAKFFVIVKTEKEIIEALQYALQNNIQYYVFSGGSNIIFTDKGFDGLVIYNKINFIEVEDNKLSIGSGCMINQAILLASKNNLCGFEKLFGIPGTIGGALYQNASAYDVAISDYLETATVYDVQSDEVVIWNKEDFLFDYRWSKMKEFHGRYIVISAIFYLLDDSDGQGKKNLMFVNAERNKRPIGNSCGSFFKNPLGQYAGKLIEDAGGKGYQVGGAQVSPLHANYIMNIGHATACDVLELSAIIKSKVKQKYNIQLEEEVRIVGVE